MLPYLCYMFTQVELSNPNLPNLPSIFPVFFFFFFLNGVNRIKYLCYHIYATCLDKWVWANSLIRSSLFRVYTVCHSINGQWLQMPCTLAIAFYFTSTVSQTTNTISIASFAMIFFSFQMPLKFLENWKLQQTLLLCTQNLSDLFGKFIFEFIL